jgi:methyl-accepting chemotaxis protein
MTIPMWWLVVSGVFFFVNLIFFGVLIYALIQIMQVAKELKPKVDRISDRVDSISEKVDDMATTVNAALKNVSQKTTNIASSAEMISSIGAVNFGRYAPVIAALGSAVKAIQMLKQLGLSFNRRKRN